MPVLSTICAAPIHFFKSMSTSIDVKALYQPPLPATKVPLSQHQIISILYQQGFLTVSEWDKSNCVTFKFPNEEVRYSFFDHLVNESSSFTKCMNGNRCSLIRALSTEDILGIIYSINSYFSLCARDGIFGCLQHDCMPPKSGKHVEGTSTKGLPTEEVFSEALHIFFRMVRKSHSESFTFKVKPTIRSARVDFLVWYRQSAYVIKLKTDSVKTPLDVGEAQNRNSSDVNGENMNPKYSLVLGCCGKKLLIREAMSWEQGNQKVFYNEDECIKNEGMERNSTTHKEKKRKRKEGKKDG